MKVIIRFLIKHFWSDHALYDKNLYQLVLKPIDEQKIKELLQIHLDKYHLARNPVRPKYMKKVPVSEEQS